MSEPVEGGFVKRSALRCPVCKSDVNPESDAWLACAHCLSRHHESCWNSGGRRCGECGKLDTPLAISDSVRLSERRERAWQRLVSFLALLAIPATAAMFAVSDPLEQYSVFRAAGNGAMIGLINAGVVLMALQLVPEAWRARLLRRWVKVEIRVVPRAPVEEERVDPKRADPKREKDGLA